MKRPVLEQIGPLPSQAGLNLGRKRGRSSNGTVSCPQCF
jgi:hypothetical protein